VVPFAAVKKATAYRARQMWIPVTVLHLVTETGSYQFGFNPWAHPLRHLNLKIEEREVRLHYSLFSVALRITVLLGLAYWLWRNLGIT